MLYLARAREIQQEERLQQARYRPPALRAMQSAGSPSNESPTATTPADSQPLPPTNFPRDFRRARAGTLPSNVQLAAQRYAAATESLQSLPGSTDSLLDTYGTQQQPQQQPQQSIAVSAGLGITPARPALRHTTSVASSAATSAVTERNSRLRSGSLNIPAAGLSNAFGGGSIFSTSWLSSNRNGSNLPGLDELRSVTSLNSESDDFDVHTLDYLGLDDNLRPPPAATLSELRTQAQAAIAGNLANPPRLRASTVSGGPYRMRSAAASTPRLPTTNSEEEEEDLMENYGHYGQSSYRNDMGLDPDVYQQQSIVARGFRQGQQHLSATTASGRSRSISVSALEDPSRSLNRIASSLEATQPMYSVGLLGGQDTLAGNIAHIATAQGNMNKISSGGAVGGRYDNSNQGRASGYLALPGQSQGRVSPKSENSPSSIQTPTRSLWIGNLDSSVTSEQLIHVFAPYGAIESLRLLPEKVRYIILLLKYVLTEYVGMRICELC